MSKELTPAGIINQVNDVKSRVANLDKSGQLFYEIWGLCPSSSSELQNFGNGNNRLESCYASFESAFDTLLANSDVAIIRISLKNSRKDLGSSEITIKPAYQSVTPAQLPAKVEKSDNDNTAQPTKQPQSSLNGSNFIQMLGQAFLGVSGLNGISNENEEMNGLGMIMAIQEKVIGDKYERQRQEDRLQNMIGENAILKNKNENLQTEVNKLNGEIEDCEDTIANLEEKLSEYEKLNPKRDMISGLAGAIIENSLLGVVSKTKYAGLLGLGENPIETAPQPIQPVSVEAVDDSPRGKAKQQITAWIDTLDDNDFSALYQLLTLFAKGSSITSCLQTMQTEPPTTAQPVAFDDDDENS